MPLIKKSFKKAMKPEMDSQPESKAQDLAVAFSTQRAAKRKGYAMGGHVDADNSASGSIAESIMKRRKMADGGMVDDDNMETPAKSSPYDNDNMEATEKELYDGSDDEIGMEPMDSEGDSEESSEEDEHDMISAIRKRMRR